MKVKKSIYKIIEAREGKRYLQMAFIAGAEDHERFDTNLPYEKSFEDWEFYSRAITKILKEAKK